MFVAAVNFEFAIDITSEAVVWDHAADSAFNEKGRTAVATGAESFRFVAPDIPGETHIGFLNFFFAPDADFVGIDHDNEISVVNMRGVGWFGFAAQEIGDFDSDMAERLISRIDDPPLAVDSLGFGREGPFVWHNVEG